MKGVTKLIKRLEEMRKEGYDCDPDWEEFQGGKFGLKVFLEPKRVTSDDYEGGQK